MKRVTAIAWAATLALAPLAACAQTVSLVRPGSALLDMSTIEAQTDTMELIVVRPGTGEQRVSSLIRTTRAARESGAEVWLMVQDYTSPGAHTSDTSIVRRADLAPLRYAAVLDGEQQRFTFHPDRVEGIVHPADSAARQVQHLLAGPAFNAVMDVDVIRSLPLREGFTAELATYNPPWPPPAHPTRIRVTGVDTLLTSAGPTETWAVEYRGSGAPAMLWIAVDDRRFVRLRAELDGGAVFWKLHRRDTDAWRRSRSGHP